MSATTPSAAWSGWTAKDIKKHRVAVYRLANGTYEAFAMVAKKPEGAMRLTPQPPRATSGDPHEGTRVAMQKLESSHPLHIQWGCHVAIKIAKRRMAVHSRDTWDELERMGIVDAVSAPAFWLGAVFKRLKTDGILKDSGQKFKYSDAVRGIHEREVKIWVLIEGADTSAYDTEPTERPKL